MFSHPLKLKTEIIPNYYMNELGEIYSENSHKVLKPYPNKEGKLVVCVLLGKTKKMFRLDYLIISTLKNFYDDIIRIIHLDDDDKNCKPSNLMAVRKIDIIEKYKKLYNVENLDSIDEIWKPSKSDSSIEVSNFGDVRRTENKNRIIPHDNHGYKEICIHGNTYSVHHLVAECFVENPKPDKFFFVNHIDGNKSNNVFYNLEWCNISMNTEHAVLTGLQKSYDEKTIRTICELLSQGMPHTKISIITGVNRKLISDIYRGRRHKAISSEYEFRKTLTLDELYNQDAVIALMKSGYKTKEISKLLRLEYNTSFISYCERLKSKIA